MANVDVSSEIVIARPREDVARYAADVYEIVELKSGERFVVRTAESPFPMKTSYTWEAVNESATRMTLRNRGRPSGCSSLMAPFMSLMMRRANRKDLKRLKQVFEADSNQGSSP